MSPHNIVEVLGVNLDPSMKPYRHDDRFVAYVPGGHVSEPMSHEDAVRLAAGMSDEACVGFLADDPEPAASKPDYSQPAPSVMSKKGRKPAG